MRDGRFHAGGHAFELPAGLAAAPGPAKLVVRPEDATLDPAGTPLPLSARLFLGHATEYRFSLPEGHFRIVGPPREVRPGTSVGVRITRARLHPEVPQRAAA